MLRTWIARYVLVGSVCLAAASQAQKEHLYHYDDPSYQRDVDKMKAAHGYLELRAGSTLKTKGRLITVVAVHQDRFALLVEGKYKNLTKETMVAGGVSIMLNESPDQQMKWFKAHPVTPEYHYGPGWNSHNEVTASVDIADPGQTGTFVAVWNVKLDTIAAEPPADLVIQVENWPD